MCIFEFRYFKNGYIKKLIDFIGYCKYSLIFLLYIVFFKIYYNNKNYRIVLCFYSYI